MLRARFTYAPDISKLKCYSFFTLFVRLKTEQRKTNEKSEMKNIPTQPERQTFSSIHEKAEKYDEKVEYKMFGTTSIVCGLWCLPCSFLCENDS